MSETRVSPTAYIGGMRLALLIPIALAISLAVVLSRAGNARSEGRVVPLPVGTRPGHVGAGTPLKPDPGHDVAIFAQGCFWGSEYRFRQVPGVTATAVGYTGGKSSNPSYGDVSGHGTGHAESVLIEFDPSCSPSSGARTTQRRRTSRGRMSALSTGQRSSP